MEGNKVVIRSYCECGCDCPKCHSGEGDVENCVYCQLKWANYGEYNKNHKVYKEKKNAHWCECGNLIKD